MTEDCVLDHRFDQQLLFDDKEYFFTFLSDRFEPLVALWARALEKRFKKTFEPIWVLSAKQNDFYTKKNYLVMNKTLQTLQRKLRRLDLIYLEDYEDLNKEFSESPFVHALIEKLERKQSRVFILPFTSSGLTITKPSVHILGPTVDVATKYDDKIEQIRLFEQLDVPRNEVRTYDSLDDIKKSETYPFFISASFSSGGHESSAIYTEQELELFKFKLREVNQTRKLLVARLISDISLSPNVSAIVTGSNQTTIVCISDQILRKNQYLGNIYPSQARERAQQIIRETATKIGNYLSTLGFRGLFGLDFIIDTKDNVYTVDLNPRRQGGYLCNVLMLKKIDLISIELALSLGESIPSISPEDFHVSCAWAHSKIKPYYDYVTITDCFKQGESAIPFMHTGTSFKTIFYPKGALLSQGNAGHFIISGETYEEVKTRTIREVEKILSTCFTLYESLPL